MNFPVLLDDFSGFAQWRPWVLHPDKWLPSNRTATVGPYGDGVGARGAAREKQKNQNISHDGIIA